MLALYNAHTKSTAMQHQCATFQSTFLPLVLREEPLPAFRVEELALPCLSWPRMYLSTKRMRNSTKYLHQANEPGHTHVGTAR